MAESVKLVPTQRWMGRDIHIPNHGKLTRQPRSIHPIDATLPQAIYLTRNFFAKPADEESADAIAKCLEGVVAPASGLAETLKVSEAAQDLTSEVLTESEASVEVEEAAAAAAPEPTHEPVSEAIASETEEEDGNADWQKVAVRFFNEATVAQIADAIVRIGLAKAEELKVACPLDWSKVKVLLTATQLRKTQEAYEAGHLVIE